MTLYTAPKNTPKTAENGTDRRTAAPPESRENIHETPLKNNEKMTVKRALPQGKNGPLGTGKKGLV